MSVDKKVIGGRVRLVLLEGIGEGRPDRRLRPGGAARDPCRVHRRGPDATETRVGTTTSERTRLKLARYAADDHTQSGPSPPRGSATLPQRVSTRPRPRHPLRGVPTSRVQDSGVCKPRRRHVPHAAHAFAGSGANRTQRLAGARGSTRTSPKRSRSRTTWGTPLLVTPARTRSTPACVPLAASSTTCSRCVSSTCSSSAMRPLSVSTSATKRARGYSSTARAPTHASSGSLANVFSNVARQPSLEAQVTDSGGRGRVQQPRRG